VGGIPPICERGEYVRELYVHTSQAYKRPKFAVIAVHTYSERDNSILWTGLSRYAKINRNK
jgi:hypothetical protein